MNRTLSTLFFILLYMAVAEVLAADGSFNDQDYRLIRKLSFEEIPEFVFAQIKKTNRVIIFYFLIMLLLFLPVIAYPVFAISERYTMFSWIVFSFFGFILFPVIIIPLHEGIHGITYLLAGARQIKTGVNWKLFYFYVTADRFPVDARWFRRIAWSPAILVTIVLILLSLLTSGQPLLAWSFLSACFVHFTMCIGDAAMAGFMREHTADGIMTIDDLNHKTVYFYLPR